MPISLELQDSSKNYLLVPLKLIEQYSTLAYQIDFETIKSFSQAGAGQSTLTALVKQFGADEGALNDFLAKSVFYSRMDHQMCFQVKRVIPAEEAQFRPPAKFEG